MQEGFSMESRSTDMKNSITDNNIESSLYNGISLNSNYNKNNHNNNNNNNNSNNNKNSSASPVKSNSRTLLQNEREPQYMQLKKLIYNCNICFTLFNFDQKPKMMVFFQHIFY